MAEFLDWSAPQDAGTANIARTAIQDQPSAGTPEHLPGPTFGESLISGALLNNSVSTGLAEMYSIFGAGDKPEAFDPNFNPRTWIEKNLPEDTRANLKDAIDGGLFDEVPGPNALQRKVSVALYEKNLLQKEGGSWLAATGGALAGSFLDPLTYVSPEAKFWTTGSTAIRLGGNIVHAAAQMAPQEAALWQMQDFRDWRQSLMNVGVGSVLGGGIGFFARSLHPENPYNPALENLSNPLREENLGKEGATTIVPGGGADVIPHDSIGDPYSVPVGEPLSVSAAATPSEAPEILGGRGVVGRALMGFTPAGRALQWASGEARSLMSKMMDLGGVYTDTNRFGVATGASAEDIRNNYLSQWHVEPQLSAETLVQQTQKDLAGLGGRRLDPVDFNATAQKLLTQTMTPEAHAELEAKYGADGATAIRRNAEQFAASRERVNAMQEDAMKRAGAIRDDAQVEALHTQIETLREQRKTELEAHDEQTGKTQDAAQERIANGEKNGTDALTLNGMRRDLREQLTQRDADRRQLAAQHDDHIAGVQKALEHQRSLAPALGKEYGHAQLWEPGQISRTQERFRNFLMDVLKVSPDENWLLEAHGMTARQFEKLKTLDPAKHLDTLHEWAGEEHDYKLRNLKNGLEDARQREKLGKLDLNDTLRQLGILKRGERQIEVSEYGRYRDQQNAEIAAARGETERLRREGQATIEAATAARQQGLDRLTQPESGAPTSARQRWEQRLGVQRAPEETTAFTRQSERALQATKALNDSEARLDALLDRQLKAERAYQDARDLRVRRQDSRRAYQDAASDVLKQRDLATQNVGQAKRAVRVTGRATPLDQAIDDIMSNLMHKGKLPASALESVVSEPGRFKARRLILTPEQKIEAARRGWLRTDLPNILRTQDMQIAGHLGLREALDYGPGRTFENWNDVEGRIRDDYSRMAEGQSEKRMGSLENERDAALKDLNGLKGRLLQQTDPGGDRDGWLMWAQKQMRQYNFIRYAQGMLPSSIPDFGAFALQHRVLPMLAEHGGEATGALFKHLEPKLNTEARRMISAAEIAVHGSMLSTRINEDDLFRSGGIGNPGSLKNRITSQVDKYGEAMSNWAGKLSGLPQWDRFWKTLSGLQMMHDLRDQVGRYGDLSEQEVTHLASLGIGSAEAKRLQGFMDKHGETDSDSGLWDPKLENWYGSEDGRQAARDFRIAVQRDMNRTRFWPGLGDRPLIADKWYGKMFTQFQNFSFAFTNRYVAQFLQRAVHFHDIRAAASFGALMASAAVTMSIKDATRGITPDKRWNADTWQKQISLGHELVDRSFLMGYLSPYADAAMTLSGLTGASRYERENVVERLGGVNASLIGDTGRFASTLSGLAQGQGKPDKAIDKLTALAPFASMLRAGGHLYDSVSNNTPARDPYKP